MSTNKECLGDSISASNDAWYQLRSKQDQVQIFRVILIDQDGEMSAPLIDLDDNTAAEMLRNVGDKQAPIR